MKALDLSEDTLEDLLSYDDLFLEYFNAFLQLPAFPVPLEYDRLIGTFQEVPINSSQGSTENSLSAASRQGLGSRNEKRYGVSDEERECMLEWCKNNRLPYFLETELFRELKLLKLLLRPLDDRHQSSASFKSSQIRGYSRQTESYISSLSNSADNSADEEEYDEGWSGETSDRYDDADETISRALSLPPKLGNVYSADANRNVARKPSHRNGKTRSHAKKVLFSQRKESSEVTPSNTEDQVVPPLFTRENTFVSINEEGSTTVTIDLSQPWQKPKRSISAPVNYKEFLHIPMYADFSDIFLNDDGELDLDPQKFIRYNEDKASEQQTESDMKNLEGKVNMSLQQMKEKIFGSRTGLEELRSFLSETNGIHLFNFWIDCETFKDTMSEDEEILKLATRNQLFRDIQDKYKMALTSDARAQIQQAASSYQLGHTVFLRAQYDVLRRLRTYWVPRFILHKEKANKLHELLGLHHLLPLPAPHKLDKLSDCFLPKISVVHSLPVDHNQILQLAEGIDAWSLISQGGRMLDTRIKSGYMRAINPKGTIDLKEKLSYALSHDKCAGSPYKSYLMKFEKKSLLSKLLFWEAVLDYAHEEDRSADRLLRMNHAWNIYNTYIADNSQMDIELDRKTRTQLLEVLRSSNDFVDVDAFEQAKDQAASGLVKSWSLYLKHDVKLLLDSQAARYGTSDRRPVFDLDSITLYCDSEVPRVLIHKPPVKLRQLTASSASTIKVRKRPPLTKSARDRRREQNLERRKQLLKEQKELLKQVKARQQESKQRRVVEGKQGNVGFIPAIKIEKDLNAKSRQSGEIPLGADGEPVEQDEFTDMYPRSGKSRKSGVSRDSGDYRDEKKSAKIQALLLDKDVEFIDMVANRPMISLFKRYLNVHDAKEYLNAVNLYNEIDVYYKTDSTPKTKKEVQAKFIYKTFMEKDAKKAVKLNEKINGRLASEKDRPKTATLKETHQYLCTYLNPIFQQFFEAQAEEFGVETRVLATMSQAELSMRSETDAAMMKQLKKAGGAGKGNKKEGEEESIDAVISVPKPRKKKQNGKGIPSKEDRQALMQAMQDSLVSGKPTVQVDYFLKYLIKYGEEDSKPLIDKDLTFYMEVQKYKELCHNYTDEEMVKKKCQAIIDCYFESVIAPPCQIDITSDISSRIVKNAVKVMQGKEIIPNLFDEAQVIAYREILPYWAGFLKTYTPPTDPNVKPLTKHQKSLLKRLEDFKNAVAPREERLVLPVIKNPVTHQNLKISSLTYSITEGLKVKDADNEEIPDAMLQTEGEDFHSSLDLDQRLRGAGQFKAIISRRKASILSSIVDSNSNSKSDIPSAIQEVR